MGGGEASRLMDTAEAIRAEMPIEKAFFYIANSNLDELSKPMQPCKLMQREEAFMNKTDYT